MSGLTVREHVVTVGTACWEISKKGLVVVSMKGAGGIAPRPRNDEVAWKVRAFRVLAWVLIVYSSTVIHEERVATVLKLIYFSPWESGGGVLAVGWLGEPMRHSEKSVPSPGW